MAGFQERLTFRRPASASSRLDCGRLMLFELKFSSLSAWHPVRLAARSSTPDIELHCAEQRGLMPSARSKLPMADTQDRNQKSKIVGLSQALSALQGMTTERSTIVKIFLMPRCEHRLQWKLLAL